MVVGSVVGIEASAGRCGAGRLLDWRYCGQTWAVLGTDMAAGLLKSLTRCGTAMLLAVDIAECILREGAAAGFCDIVLRALRDGGEALILLSLGPPRRGCGLHIGGQL